MIHNYMHTENCRDALSKLFEVTTLMAVDMRRGLASYGLTEARVPILWQLGVADRVTQRDLAESLKVTPRNITALIDALEETGFVRRTDHPTDRRAIVIVLTEKGQQTVATLQSEMVRFAELLFGDMPEGDLLAFRQMLGGIAERLAALVAGQAPSAG